LSLFCLNDRITQALLTACTKSHMIIVTNVLLSLYFIREIVQNLIPESVFHTLYLTSAWKKIPLKQNKINLTNDYKEMASNTALNMKFWNK